MRANTHCSPTAHPVDTRATGEAICLVTRLDRWRTAGLMGVGQQLNVSSSPDDAFAPVTELEDPVAVVGFDLEELAKTGDTRSRSSTSRSTGCSRSRTRAPC